VFLFHGGLHGGSQAGKDAAGYGRQDARHNRSGNHSWLP